MKKSILILFVFGFGIAHAQNITIDYQAQEKFQYDLFLLDGFLFDVGPSGQGVVWDYLNLESLDWHDGSVMIPAKGSAFEHLFPTANYVSFAAEKTAFNYYNYNKQGHILIGSVDLYDSVYSFHSGIDTLIKYPMRYGDKWSFNTSNTEISKTHKIDSAYSEVETFFHVDAEGVMILPDSSRRNALRLKTIVNFDSDAFEKGKFRYKKKTKRLRYAFYIPDFPISEIIYLQIDSTQFINKEGHVFKEEEKRRCRGFDPVFTPSQQNQAFDMNSKITNSKTTWQLTFNLKEIAETNIQLYNSNGQAIKSYQLPKNEVNRGANITTIDHSDLAAGIYIVRINSGVYTDVEKILKQ